MKDTKIHLRNCTLVKAYKHKKSNIYDFFQLYRLYESMEFMTVFRERFRIRELLPLLKEEHMQSRIQELFERRRISGVKRGIRLHIFF